MKLSTPPQAIHGLTRLNLTVVAELRRLNKVLLEDYRQLQRTTRTDAMNYAAIDEYVAGLALKYGQWFAQNQDVLQRSVALVSKTAQSGNALRFNWNMRQALNRTGKSVLYPDLSIAAEEGVSREISDAWQLQQINLIKKDGTTGPNAVPSIPQEHFERLTKIVQDAVHNGDRWEDLAAQLQQLDGVDARRAELIARDQTNKYNAVMTQSRSKSLGIAQFYWRTVGDDSVRPEHRARNGHLYRYDNPPDGELPGEPVQCRCYADPDFEAALAARRAA